MVFEGRFHINSKGEAAPCRAKLGNCPLGGEHFDDLASAEAEVFARTLDAAEIRSGWTDEQADEFAASYGSEVVVSSLTRLDIQSDLRSSNAITDGLFDAGVDYETASDVGERLRISTCKIDQALVGGRQVELKDAIEDHVEALDDAFEASQEGDDPDLPERVHDNKVLWTGHLESVLASGAGFRSAPALPTGWDSWGSSERDLWVEQNGWPDADVEVFAHAVEVGDRILFNGRRVTVSKIDESAFHTEVGLVPYGRGMTVLANKSR